MRRLGIERLESRLVPSTFEWYGSTSTDWGDSSNWRVGGAATMLLPGLSDEALFSTNAVRNCLIGNGGNMTVKKITSDSMFSGYSLITTGVLTVSGAGTSSTWGGGNFEFSAFGTPPATRGLYLNDVNFTWSSGWLGLGGGGAIRAYSETLISVTGSPNGLACDLYVGQDSMGAVDVANPVQMDVGCETNIEVTNSSTITIGGMSGMSHGGGGMSFEYHAGGMASNTGVSSGVYGTNSTTPKIVNYGSMTWEGEESGTDFFVMGLPVLNYNEMRVYQDTWVKFMGAECIASNIDVENIGASVFYLSGGTTGSESRAEFSVQAVWNGDSFTGLPYFYLGPGSSEVTDGDVIMNAGYVEWYGALGTGGFLNIAGSIQFYNSSQVTFRIAQVSSVYRFDSIRANDIYIETLDDTTVALDTSETPANINMDVMTADNSLSVFGFTNEVLAGWTLTHDSANKRIRISQ